MARKLRTIRRDDRIAQALRDPDAYFRRARERARAEVIAEMAHERRRPTRTRRPT